MFLDRLNHSQNFWGRAPRPFTSRGVLQTSPTLDVRFQYLTFHQLTHKRYMMYVHFFPDFSSADLYYGTPRSSHIVCIGGSLWLEYCNESDCDFPRAKPECDSPKSFNRLIGNSQPQHLDLLDWLCVHQHCDCNSLDNYWHGKIYLISLILLSMF